MSECPRHADLDRRVGVVEGQVHGQVEENAKIWKAINTIREEKAKDSTILMELVDKVDKIDKRMEAGFKEMMGEIDKLKAVPGKRWDTLVSDVIKEIVALGIGVAMTYLAIKGGP